MAEVYQARPWYIMMYTSTALVLSTYESAALSATFSTNGRINSLAQTCKGLSKVCPPMIALAAETKKCKSVKGVDNRLYHCGQQ